MPGKMQEHADSIRNVSRIRSDEMSELKGENPYKRTALSKGKSRIAGYAAVRDMQEACGLRQDAKEWTRKSFLKAK